MNARHATEDRLLQHADDAAAHVDRQIAGLWQDLLEVISQSEGHAKNYQRALAIFRQFGPTVGQSLSDRFLHLWKTGRQASIDRHLQDIPVSAMRRRLTRGLVKESWRPHLSNTLGVQLYEDRRDEEEASDFVNLAAPLDDPAALAAMTGEEVRSLFDSVLFPPPPLEQVQSLLDRFVMPWSEQAVGDRVKRMPEDLAKQLADAMAQGLSQRDVAKSVLPFVDGSRVRARRAARTFGLYVAHQGQEAADEELGDMVKGYTVHASIDSKTRPEHKARDGTKYWFKPGPGQKGMDECPHPPLESPRDGSKTSFNCRCFITPILDLT